MIPSIAACIFGGGGDLDQIVMALLQPEVRVIFSLPIGSCTEVDAALAPDDAAAANGRVEYRKNGCPVMAGSNSPV